MSYINRSSTRSNVALMRPKVALINSIVAQHDAISAAVIDTYKCLTQDGAFDVSLFSYKNDFNEIKSHNISSLDELLLHREFLDAEILLWHFGIFYELFNSTLVGNGRALRVARFHNVTPKEFTPQHAWETIDRSLSQCHLLRGVDEVWADSTVNAETAVMFGVDAERIRTIPLVVEGQRFRSLEFKAQPYSILFVGRFVKSKGVLELLQAVATLRRSGLNVPISVNLVGNVEFSDPAYVADIHAYIQHQALGDVVQMLGTVDEPALRDLYRDAHILAIPSYHEGFCKPVVEALQAGCIPIGYASYNLPFITNGFGRLVTPGDVESLSAVLRDIIEALPGAAQSPTTARLPLDRGLTSITSFSSEVRRYVERFTAESVGEEMRRRLQDLLVSRNPSLLG